MTIAHRPEARAARLAAAVQALEGRRLLAADLLISEFLASNQNGLADNFGERSDWVEIHNRGTSAGSLSGFGLTDDAAAPFKWRFPAVSVPAGGYLLVWTSDRNIATVGQPLHAPFKLSAGGEYLGLTRPDGTPQTAFAPAFPAQTTDVSYGLTNESDPASGLQFFGTPTPNARNVPSAAAATFGVAGRVFANAFTLTLSSATPGAVVRYTTDRTDPTATSPIYAGPISIAATTMVRARVFAPGHNPSPIVGQSYVYVDASVAGIDTNLGTVVVDTYGAALNDSTYTLGSGTFVDARATADGRAGALDDADYHGRIGLRVRGSSSQGFPKQQFAVELWDEQNQDRDASLLGMPADSDWILYAPYSEKSLMQNALAFGWANAIGGYAPRTRFVELYLNTDGGTRLNYSSDYWGVYLLVEKIKVGPDRVDLAGLDAADVAEPAITGGYLWKKDRLDPDEIRINTPRQEFGMVDPDVITSGQQQWLSNHLTQFEAALYGADFKSPTLGYAKFIDVDSWVDHWLMVEMGKNIDGFRLSTFYAKDRGGKITMGPEWDFNLSLGNGYYHRGNDASGWYSDPWPDGEYPYFRRLFQDAAFKQKLVDRWAELRQTTFATPALAGDIDALVAELSDGNGNYPVGASPAQASNNAVVRNFKRWPVLGVYRWPNGFYDVSGRWIEDVRMMKGWLSGRVAWMDAQLLPAPVASVPGGYRTTPAAVALTPSRVTNVDTLLAGGPGAAVRAIVPSGEINNWTNVSFNAASWLAGTGGVGYDANVAGVNFNPLIGLDLSSMRNVRSSAFARYAFSVADPSSIESLVLKMKYDDGFAAYLNGHRITAGNDEGSREGTGNPMFTRWDAPATAVRNDNDAVAFEEFDVSAWRSLITTGTNVLAIHVMNRTADSSDLLALPELVSRRRVTPGAAGDTVTYYTTDGSDPLAADGVTIGPSALPYASPIPIDRTTRIKTRSVRAGAWSGLGDHYYSFETDALRVSEIMYHPADDAGGAFDAGDFEFVELLNTGDRPLRLDGYRFAGGIDFTFSNVVVPAGETAVVAKNLAAFQARYGTSVLPVGTFGGALDNAGERLTLVDPFGDVAQSFVYDDAWHPITDGGGASLEVTAPPATIDLNLPASWRASAAANGTPGVVDLVSPTLASVDYLYEAAPGALRLIFSEDVGASLDLSDVMVVNTATGAVFTPASLVYDAATRAATLTLPPGALADGDYRVTVRAGGVADAAGNPLAADASGDFFVLVGDANRDRVVNFTDLVILAQNYNGSGRTFSQGNFDYSADGLVGFSDLVLLAQKYGMTLPTNALDGAAIGTAGHVAAPRARKAGAGGAGGSVAADVLA